MTSPSADSQRIRTRPRDAIPREARQGKAMKNMTPAADSQRVKTKTKDEWNEMLRSAKSSSTDRILDQNCAFSGHVLGVDIESSDLVPRYGGPCLCGVLQEYPKRPG